MIKPKVGMKVRVKYDLEYEKCYGIGRLYCAGEMLDFRGKIGKIVSVGEGIGIKKTWFKLDISRRDDWTWCPEMVEFVDAKVGIDLSHIKPYPIVAFLNGRK